MKITKRQLRRIISESMIEEPFDITTNTYGVGERIGYDYTVTERRPSLFQGIGGQPMERVAFEYRISPGDDTIVYGSLPAVPKGMPLKDFFAAGLNGGFPDMYPPIPPQNVATGTAKGMPRVGETIKEGKMKITRKQIRKMILETMNISEGTLHVTRSPYGMTVEDDDDNYISIGDMVQALLAAGQDDFFQGPQGVDPEALAKLNRKNAEGIQGGMLRWDADVFEDYYSVDNDRVLRLFARLNNHSIKELPYQD